MRRCHPAVLWCPLVSFGYPPCLALQLRWREATSMRAGGGWWGKIVRQWRLGLQTLGIGRSGMGAKDNLTDVAP